jgi:hypothetical protein
MCYNPLIMAENIEKRPSVQQVISKIEDRYKVTDKGRALTLQEEAALRDKAAWLNSFRDRELSTSPEDRSAKTEIFRDIYDSVFDKLRGDSYGVKGEKMDEVELYQAQLERAIEAEGPQTERDITNKLATTFNNITERLLSTEIPPFK